MCPPVGQSPARAISTARRMAAPSACALNNMQPMAKATNARVSVFLVDGEPLVRLGLAAVISSQPDLDICGAASGGTEALNGIRSLAPDVAIVDLRLPVEEGFEWLRQLQHDCPGLKILVFSMHADAAFVQAMSAAGVAGCVTKGETAETILEAIETVAAGRSYFPSSAPIRNTSAPPLASKAGPGPARSAGCLRPGCLFPNAVGGPVSGVASYDLPAATIGAPPIEGAGNFRQREATYGGNGGPERRRGSAPG